MQPPLLFSQAHTHAHAHTQIYTYKKKKLPFLSLSLSSLFPPFHQAATASFFAALAFTISSTNISKHTSASCGPGLASGWYWMLSAALSFTTKPAQVPSLRLMCVTSTLAGSEAGSTAKLWFWAEISTRPEGLWRIGWLPPWWPNLSLKVELLVKKERGEREERCERER